MKHIHTHSREINMHINHINMHINHINMHINHINMHINHINMHINHVSMHINHTNMHINHINMHINHINMHVNHINMHINHVSMHINHITRVYCSQGDKEHPMCLCVYHVYVLHTMLHGDFQLPSDDLFSVKHCIGRDRIHASRGVDELGHARPWSWVRIPVDVIAGETAKAAQKRGLLLFN